MELSTERSEECHTTCKPTCNTVKKYQNLAGPGFKLNHVATPFLDVGDSGGVFAPAGEGRWIECPWRQGRFAGEHLVKGKGSGALRSMAKAKPLLNAADIKQQGEAKQRNRGQLHTTAMKVPMSVLHAARMARFDLLRAVGALATKVTKWDRVCDK